MSQPAPRPGRKAVVPEVLHDLVDRAIAGQRKYGTSLKTHNGRDALLDAYEEALDLACYLKQALMEREDAILAVPVVVGAGDAPLESAGLPAGQLTGCHCNLCQGVVG